MLVMSCSSIHTKAHFEKHIIITTIITLYQIQYCWTSVKQPAKWINEENWLPTQWRCELTPYSQRAHLNYLMMGSLSGHSFSSQWTQKMTPHCELSVSMVLTHTFTGVDLSISISSYFGSSPNTSLFDTHIRLLSF